MENRKPDIHISRNIARLRRKMGLTQTELAERLYVSNKTVSKWERGAGYPETPQLVRLADLFGVSLDTLIRGEKNGIAVAGNILTDEVKIIESFPEKGMLVNITAMSRAVGGSVPNTLISLAEIDMEWRDWGTEAPSGNHAGNADETATLPSLPTESEP